ncbi:MAG: tRNA (adenosine(37)-N6)-threonylcarbamoyltransferase complex dimerization subunit type 1 TsaB [Giesbergeria sp.]|nr:tRNA (adenosine(37)-N6)-threonylcarbamoyltransferase complex dimerization subunit type 1 TsaB [Giesbergeria sp.]MBP6418788.1 tRNA (adenosine(37)-N6)-threonylcarbamoyltransferase complex dimerization subunit type 1 TsaB [Giesbergeria sp.]
MNLLAFDTSTDTLSIAVARGAARWQHSGPGGAQASATLLPAIRQLLAEAGLALGDLDAIAFGRGPGSFTGLRTACAVAQGLAFGAGGGRSVPVLPIDTLAAVAEAARQQYGCTDVVAVLDARMNEVYWARYQWQGSSDGDFGLCAPEALVAAPGWSVVGNAQTIYGERLAPDAQHLHALPEASALLNLAPALLAAGGAVPAAQALPRYIRNKVAKTTQERAHERAAQAALATLAAAA